MTGIPIIDYLGFMSRPEYELLKDGYKEFESLTGGKCTAALEKEETIAEKRGDTPPIRYVLENFLGGILNNYGINNLTTNDSITAWPKGIDLEKIRICPEDSYAEAKNYVDRYNEMSETKKIEIIPLYIDKSFSTEFEDTVKDWPENIDLLNNAPSGKVLAAYAIRGLEKGIEFCPLRELSLMITKVEDITTPDGTHPKWLNSKVISRGSKLEYSLDKSCGDNYGNFEKLLVYRQKEGNQKTLFEGEDFEDSSLERRLGISLSDMGITPGPNSKIEAFRKWLHYAVESEKGYNPGFAVMTERQAINFFTKPMVGPRDVKPQPKPPSAS